MKDTVIKTREEAIEAAIKIAEPGDHVIIHQDCCKYNINDSMKCNCNPEVWTKGDEQ